MVPTNGTFIGKYMNIGDIDMSVEFRESDFVDKFRNIDIEGTFLYRINLTRSNKDDDHFEILRKSLIISFLIMCFFTGTPFST